MTSVRRASVDYAVAVAGLALAVYETARSRHGMNAVVARKKALAVIKDTVTSLPEDGEQMPWGEEDNSDVRSQRKLHAR